MWRLITLAVHFCFLLRHLIQLMTFSSAILVNQEVSYILLSCTYIKLEIVDSGCSCCKMSFARVELWYKLLVTRGSRSFQEQGLFYPCHSCNPCCGKHRTAVFAKSYLSNFLAFLHHLCQGQLPCKYSSDRKVRGSSEIFI